MREIHTRFRNAGGVWLAFWRVCEVRGMFYGGTLSVAWRYIGARLTPYRSIPFAPTIPGVFAWLQPCKH